MRRNAQHGQIVITLSVHKHYVTAVSFSFEFGNLLSYKRYLEASQNPKGIWEHAIVFCADILRFVGKFSGFKVTSKMKVREFFFFFYGCSRSILGIWQLPRIQKVFGNFQKESRSFPESKKQLVTYKIPQEGVKMLQDFGNLSKYHRNLRWTFSELLASSQASP